MRSKHLSTVILAVLLYSISDSRAQQVPEPYTIRLEQGRFERTVTPEEYGEYISKLTEFVKVRRELSAKREKWEIVITGSYSEAIWDGKTPEVRYALDGGLVIARGGDVVRLLFSAAGLRNEEKVFLRFIPDRDQTTEGEPYARVEVQRYLSRDELSGSAYAIRVKNGKVQIKDADRAKLEEIVGDVNGNPQKGIIISTNDPAKWDGKSPAEMVLKELQALGLENAKEKTSLFGLDGPPKGRRDVVVDVVELGSDEEEGESSEVGEIASSTSSSKSSSESGARRSVISAGLSVSGMSDLNNHPQEDVPDTHVIPTLSLGFLWNRRIGVAAEVQMPGVISSNEGGDINLAEVGLQIAVVRALYLTLKYGQPVTQKEHQVPTGQQGVLRQEGRDFGVGLDYHPRKYVLLGVAWFYGDRTYSLPPRFEIEETGHHRFVVRSTAFFSWPIGK